MGDPHVPKGICSDVHVIFIKKILSDLLSARNAAKDTYICQHVIFSNLSLPPYCTLQWLGLLKMLRKQPSMIAPSLLLLMSSVSWSIPPTLPSLASTSRGT